jgi:hypothetical protein
MTVTTTKLTRAAGLSAVVGGLLFIAVQINHPLLNAAFTTTTEYAVRETMKILMAVFSLIGITGIYLRQVRQTGVLGLIGYLLFGAGYLAIMSVQIVGVFVLPSFAATQPGYVNDVLAVATGGTPGGDIGALAAFIRIGGFTFLTGGVVFGIALFRANILPRWAAALLVAGTLVTFAMPLLPQINQRLFAIPTSVAVLSLGYSLWREQRTQNTRPMASSVSSQLDPTGVK